MGLNPSDFSFQPLKVMIGIILSVFLGLILVTTSLLAVLGGIIWQMIH